MTLLQDISTAQLMSRRLSCIAPDASVESAIHMMRTQSVSCLLVTHERRLVGMVTERDLVKCLDIQLSRPAGSISADQLGRVADIMSAKLITVRNDDSLVRALQICMTKSIRHLPVVNGAGNLVGVITQTDLVRAYAHILERQLALETDNERLKALSLVDPLMGIGNRRAMERDLAHILSLIHI